MTYEEKNFICARKLIEYLSPLDTGLWAKRIFRGHGCSSFGLIPSVVRYSPCFNESTDTQLGASINGHVHFELSLLDSFLDGCDASGIQIPGDSPHLRNQLQNYFLDNSLFGDFADWPSSSAFPVLATAQHHGIPTCLLDWSKRSYVAAYFAASQALRESQCPSPQSDTLCIWSLNITNHRHWSQVKYVETQGFVSINRASQDGVFTATALGAQWGKASDAALENFEELYRPSQSGRPGLSKYSLPRSEASHLLEICAAFGVKGSTLFPGYEGVAREVEDMRLVKCS
ncbi:FRG domain-containing protein [Vreelandella gomseomensis]|uniref:FRG domain-containing protein n=1 Tax=Vreelandella gomseomensis TaxID=370766 RepID=A0ABU1GAK5_9GAMM|nr:FRG domain-containing protein [Halomonas gomseomensis]MDR5874094.1 FRG domain-containing protein [Halomonas gomseomensis]